MTSPALVRSADHTGKRVRASRKAIEAALEALAARGLAVDKLCVEGGKVEIVIASVEADSAPVNRKGLEKW